MLLRSARPADRVRLAALCSCLALATGCAGSGSAASGSPAPPADCSTAPQAGTILCDGPAPELVVLVSRPAAHIKPELAQNTLRNRCWAEVGKSIEGDLIPTRVWEVARRLEAAGRQFWSDTVLREQERAVGDSCESCGHNFIRFMNEAPFGARTLAVNLHAASAPGGPAPRELCADESLITFAVPVGAVQELPFASPEALAVYLTEDGVRALRDAWTLCPAPKPSNQPDPT